MDGVEVSMHRTAGHGIVSRPCPDVAGAASLTGGIQAQDTIAARLGVRTRSSTVTEADVMRAIAEDRTVVRSWLMRATIHLVDSRDLGWMTALLGPMIRRRFTAARWAELGLTPDVLSRVETWAPDVLADGPLTRHELNAALAERGIELTGIGQAPTHLALYLSTIALICRAGDRGGQATFALTDAWLGDTTGGPRGDDALAELARRYFRAFGPATATDFTTWSGLPSSRAIALIRDELTPVSIEGRAGYVLGPLPGLLPDLLPPARSLRLLPAFDNYLIGYRDRDLVIDPERRSEVYIGGVIRPTVLVDGRVSGRWRLVRRPSSALVEVTLFDAAHIPTVRAAIEDEVADIGRFLAVPTTVHMR